MAAQTLERIAAFTDGNDSFSQEFPGIQLAFDTGSTAALKKCPRFHQLSIIEGWQKKRENVHLRFGLIAHSTRETYDRAKVSGDSHEIAVRKAIRYCLEASGSRRDALLCKDCGWTTAYSPTTMMICLACNSEDVVLHKSHFFPWKSDDSHKNRRNLIRTMVWYFDYYKNAPEKTVILADGTPAVELWFRFELPLQAPDGTDYILTGHLDRLVEISGMRLFQDLKTTKSTINDKFFLKFNPDNQVSQYTAGGRIAFDIPILGGIIDAAQVAVNFTNFLRSGPITLTKDQIDEWLRDVQHWIKKAEEYAADGYWPMNDTACHQYGGCDFRGICNKDPASRRQHLLTKFEQVSWNPLKDRRA